MKALILAAALAAGLPMAANAVSITANQGLNGAGGSVAADRSDLGKISDGIATNQSIFSLGLGGFLSASVDPQALANPIMVIEITNNTPNPLFPEAVNLFLGGSVSGPGGLDGANSFDSTGAIQIGTLSNDGAPTAIEMNGALITKTQTNSSTKFTIDIANVGNGIFSRLTLVDITSGTGASVDGFDIGELTVNAVPLPASALLLLSGLAGFGFVSRRRRAAA
ncbi:VPLPA-CTERM sorting domain-containing protein [Pikeienuella piscinae]|uniref:VPLPA-CTERM sorting domain-containing protein n=1 Tax=Pikeienuella piscinae TaxID=2748098 RepID=A0A7L5BUN0_9RHOB|nr:VPLPA-CTERM sorting domain-containing protein [Pikeienuella piscinae]QIE55352.1 VPLPA-CTERM sorting domain-containing protein [Pikeienuella piscinae]